MVLEEGALFADRYQLIKLLGRGGFSEVWLANDTKSGVDVALKVYAPYGGLDEHGNRLFSQEFSLVFNINQTNLLKPTYYDTYERSPYLILPYCGRGSALDLVGKTDEKTMIDILHDVASGLAYLHAQEPPIIHQDIKPDNILINDHGDYVITDFGISTKIRSTLRQSAVSQEEHSGGTYAYMAPERFSKTPTPIRASDIWSLGAMCYELLDGNPPFDTMGGVMQKNGAEIPEIQANVSDTLKNIVYACVAMETWDRPTAETIVEWTNKLRAGESLNLGGKEKKGRINNLFKQTIMRDGKSKSQKQPKPEQPAPAPAPAPVPDPVSSSQGGSAPQPQVRSFIESGGGSSHGKSHGNSHGNSNGKSGGKKKMSTGLLVGIIVGVLAIAGLAIGLTVAGNKKRAAHEAAKLLAEKKAMLENKIFDDNADDRTFPCVDEETGATLHSAQSLFHDALKLLKSQLDAPEGVEILKRVSDADYHPASANATAMLGFLTAKKDIVRLDDEGNVVLDAEGKPEFLLDSIYRAYGNKFKTADCLPVSPAASHRYSEKALEQDKECYMAHYEMALDYLQGSAFGRTEYARDMIRATVHVFRGKKYAAAAKDEVYMELFDVLYSNPKYDWAYIIKEGDTKLKRSELEDIWDDLMNEVKK